MDNPLARAVPALPLPRPPEPPEPNGGSAGPVAAVVPPSPVVTAIETPALANPVDLGQTFLAWLKQGLVSGQLPVNTVHARVHRVREGLVLVSPGIFRDYAAAAQAPWANIQKCFQKLHPANLVPYSSILL
jgi:Putative conjugal transfer nickase/helicase TraI C-term